ncbi:MAG TPA: DNA replication and repair protein RecF, partial [Dehalococcoidia bacterium]|nr:DNA replication and repair protein RecF [Dehalococcoidia bacterium]
RDEALTVRYLPSAGTEEGGLLDGENWLARLAACRDREVALAQSVIGPHRDDLAFAINGVDVAHFGSRGQQRSVALSLKVAEAAFMTECLAEPPVLLLDDMMSELDRGRRNRILADILPDQQVILTATDVDEFPAEFLAGTQRFRVEHGVLQAAG